MLRIRTHHYALRELTTKQNHVNSVYRFRHFISTGLWKFWQFSCFYGDYISQPLEHRGEKSTSSQKSID